MPDEIKLESLSHLAKLYANQNQLPMAITLLQQAYDLSAQQPYWHCRIIFQIIVDKFRNNVSRSISYKTFLYLSESLSFPR